MSDQAERLVVALQLEEMAKYPNTNFHYGEHVELVKRAAALLSAPSSPGDGWEPIETLKREWLPLGPDSCDGTWNTEWVLCGRYQGRHFVSWVGMLDADTWLARDDRGHCVETDEPTHWRPLPAAPSPGGDHE